MQTTSDLSATSPRCCAGLCGPRILRNSWSEADQWLPGLLFSSIGRGDATDVSLGSAIATALVYLAVALVAAGTVFVRRDVTT